MGPCLPHRKFHREPLSVMGWSLKRGLSIGCGRLLVAARTPVDVSVVNDWAHASFPLTSAQSVQVTGSQAGHYFFASSCISSAASSARLDAIGAGLVNLLYKLPRFLTPAPSHTFSNPPGEYDITRHHAESPFLARCRDRLVTLK
ncbi:uncharacterized protein SPSK_06720 [Sporothrix schenckii 1099-18]|uniref:Uncharacterized protein n=1 Tax=Sporothrix schenckii 1099-18 TaxID=1397361 RepID=A0A0F2ML49_SPOSC|nr:uncharacterized protein SPSK_06720 [Sporothrix schenckii 1099-18]KJR89540.1 hypothetical protein SPSK_06720 [Sporothrix schenckii 1099-18]